VVPGIEAQLRVNARWGDGTATGADPLGASDSRDGYLPRSSDEEMMRQLKRVACKTRLRSRKADLIGSGIYAPSAALRWSQSLTWVKSSGTA
jgi:hypothetical protein